MHTDPPVEDYMAIALDLAGQAQGKTRPNPPVGAVVVKDGRIVGKGFTQPAGQPHAEIVALTEAGQEARGAEIYASLEPCSHWGRTPPCSEALIEAGITRAHIALLDPNPQVRGRGVARLRESGVEVIIGQGADAAAELVEAHAVYTVKGRPFITVVNDDVARDVVQELMERNDVVLGVEASDLSVQDLLTRLKRDQVTSCLIVGNQRLVSELHGEDLVDRVITSNEPAS